MKKLWIICCIGLALACNGPAKETAPAATADAASNTPLPMPTDYDGTGDPTIGKRDNQVIVMNFNKFMSQKNGQKAGELLSDSVFFSMADGKDYALAHDSAVAFLQSWLDMVDSINVRYIASLPIDIKGANEEWVLQWTDETYRYKNGKKEHITLNENYRLKDNKIRQIIQHYRPLQ